MATARDDELHFHRRPPLLQLSFSDAKVVVRLPLGLVFKLRGRYRAVDSYSSPSWCSMPFPVHVWGYACARLHIMQEAA